MACVPLRITPPSAIVYNGHSVLNIRRITSSILPVHSSCYAYEKKKTVFSNNFRPNSLLLLRMFQITLLNLGHRVVFASLFLHIFLASLFEEDNWSCAHVECETWEPLLRRIQVLFNLVRERRCVCDWWVWGCKGSLRDINITNVSTDSRL